jgi:hypothetical protein
MCVVGIGIVILGVAISAALMWRIHGEAQVITPKETQDLEVDEKEEDMARSVDLRIKTRNDNTFYVEYEGDEESALKFIAELLNEKKTGFFQFSDELLLNIEQISSIEVY